MFYFVMFGFYLLEACSFLKRDRKGLGPEGKGGREDLGREEGGETNQDILYEKKNPVSINTKKKSPCLWLCQDSFV